MIPPNTRSISSPILCSRCLHEALVSGKNPRYYQELEVGMTPSGLQVWCVRHESNVIHLGLRGHTLPINVTVEEDGGRVVIKPPAPPSPSSPPDPTLN
jgi:hypothetical protein